jgi:hypothetical protein
MDMPELEDMNMVEEQDNPTNHRRGEEDIHMVEEHYHPMNHLSEVEGMDMEEELYHRMNHQPEVEGIDREDSVMWEDMMVELNLVERELEGVVLMRHWTDDEVARDRRAHREWEEFVKSGCSEGQPMFTSRNSNCCSSWLEE